MGRTEKETTATKFLKRDGKHPCNYRLIGPEEKDVSWQWEKLRTSLMCIASFSEDTEIGNPTYLGNCVKGCYYKSQEAGKGRNGRD